VLDGRINDLESQGKQFLHFETDMSEIKQSLSKINDIKLTALDIEIDQLKLVTYKMLDLEKAVETLKQSDVEKGREIFQLVQYNVNRSISQDDNSMNCTEQIAGVLQSVVERDVKYGRHEEDMKQSMMEHNDIKEELRNLTLKSAQIELEIHRIKQNVIADLDHKFNSTSAAMNEKFEQLNANLNHWNVTEVTKFEQIQNEMKQLTQSYTGNYKAEVDKQIKNVEVKLANGTKQLFETIEHKLEAINKRTIGFNVVSKMNFIEILLYEPTIGSVE